MFRAWVDPVSYFDDVRNQIDIECQTYSTKDDLTVEDKESAIQQREEVLVEVGLFQNKSVSRIWRHSNVVRI